MNMVDWPFTFSQPTAVDQTTPLKTGFDDSQCFGKISFKVF